MKTQGEKWFMKKLDRMRSLNSYAIEDTVDRIAQKLGMNPHEIVKLNQNENFFLPRDLLHVLLKQVIEEYDPRIYPQEEEFELKEKLSGYLNVRTDSIVIGNGGDELIERTAIRAMIEEFPGVVIVDEAYVEFAEYCLLPFIDKYENLIVLRTFSKAFGLAGLRLGYGVANPDLATTLSQKAQLPYPVSSLALKVGLKLLENHSLVENAVKQMKDERGTLIRKLDEINGVKAFDSKANFILFQTDRQSDEVYQSLLSRGIFVRNIKNPHLRNCLRTTVGLPKMNSKLLEGLKEIAVNQE